MSGHNGDTSRVVTSDRISMSNDLMSHLTSFQMFRQQVWSGVWAALTALQLLQAGVPYRA